MLGARHSSGASWQQAASEDKDAPLGIDDLVDLRCRPTTFGRTRRHEYEARIAAKRWRELWPKVRFLD